MNPSQPRRVEVDPARLRRWLDGFQQRHGQVTYAVAQGALVATAQDGSTACCGALQPYRAPHEAELAGSPDQPPDLAADLGADLAADFVAHAEGPVPVVLLLVRRGGYGVGLVTEGALVAHKVGTRYVQSRTAAGGWSQQRFARRRDNQTAGLVDAAAEAVVRLVLGEDGRQAPSGAVVVTGGDRALAERLLADRRLATLATLPVPRHLDVPDPRAAVLRDAARRAVAVQVDVHNA